MVGENGLSCSPGNVTKENIRKEKFIKIIFLYTYRQCNHHFFSFAPNYKIVSIINNKVRRSLIVGESTCKFDEVWVRD